MKVLFSLLDAGVGGGQRVALGVADRLAAEGDGIGLFVPREGPAAEEFRALGAVVYHADLQTLRRAKGIAPAADIAREYDLLYSHTSVPGEILGQRVARRAGIRHVVHRHTDPHFSPRPATRTVQRWLYRRTLLSTPFIAVAPHVASALERLGIPRQLVTVVPNGVDVYAVWLRVPAAERPRLRVGALGRFDPSRGLDRFVEAARRMSREDVSFVIGGATGPFREHEQAVRRSARDAGVAIEEPGSAGVEFLGSLDVVVIPSRYEGSPLTLFEAMALGKPIVASDIPGIAEVLRPSDAGVLVPSDDADALARAITELVDDPERGRALGHTALEVVRRDHDLAEMLDRAVEVLRDGAQAT